MNHDEVRNDVMLNHIYTTLLAECYTRHNVSDIEERFKLTPNEVVDILTEHYESIFCADDEEKPAINKRLDRIEADIEDLKNRLALQNYHDAHFI